MKKAYILGIAGGTQSGKSTFANELEKTLKGIKLKIFHIDHYHKPKDEWPLAKSPVTNIIYNDANQPESFDISKLRLDIENENLKKEVDLIIVEGTMILYDEEIFKMLDLKLYVETRADERAIRYIDLYSQYHGHDFIKNSYLDLVRYRMDEYVEFTKWKADIMINGSMKSEQAVEIIKTFLLTQISN